MLPSPTVSDTNGAGLHGDGGMDLRTAISLLPTPNYQRSGRNQSASDGAAVRWSLDYVDRLLGTPTARDHKGTGPVGSDLHAWLLHGNVEAQLLALMPTPRATDGTKGGPNQRGSSGDLMLPSAVSLLPTPTTEPLTGNGHARHLGAEVQPDRWGEYGPAIRRWEALTRPAPEPTKLNAKGNPKLSDEFDEWLMGFPKGWITDVPGVTWNEVLKACGNGVLWQQGAAGLRWLLRMGRAA